MKYFPLLIFLFVLLFESSYSIRPKKDIYELPIVFNNRTNNSRTSNFKYFSFNLNKSFKSNLLYFQINTSLSEKNISYTFTGEPKERLNLNNIEKVKDRIWYDPNIIFIRRLPMKIIYKIGVYTKRHNFSRKTLIIRVGPMLKNENITCAQLYNASTIIKNQKYNVSYDQNKYLKKNHSHHKEHKHDHWHKDKFDRKNHGKNWLNTSDKYGKKYKKYHKHVNGKIFSAIVLISLWSIIVVLYCLVNRRKKPFVAELKNPQQVSLSDYHNV